MPYADPNEMGQALIAGAADAGVRLTLLDTCYLSSGVDGAPLAQGPQQRFGDGSGDALGRAGRGAAPAGRRATTVIVGAALHSVRGVPLEHMPAVVEWAAAHDAPLHVHSSEQTAEVDQCLAVHGATPTALLRDAGVLGPRTTAVHATHLTDEDIADLDRTATGVCFCPTTERDLGDGIGPAAALLAGRGLFSLGSDSPRGDRPVRGGAGHRTRRAAGPPRTRRSSPPSGCCAAATLDGQHALGLDGRGRRCASVPAPTWWPSTWTRSAPRAAGRPSRTSCSPPPPPTSPTSSSTAASWSPTGRHRGVDDVAAALAESIIGR